MENGANYATGIYLTNLKISEKSEYIPRFCLNQFILRNYYTQDKCEIPIAILPSTSYMGHLNDHFTFSRVFNFYRDKNKLPLVTIKYRRREYFVGYHYIQDKQTGKIILGEFFKREDLEELKLVFKASNKKGSVLSSVRYPNNHFKMVINNSIGNVGILGTYSKYISIIPNELIPMELNASDIFETIPIDLNTVQEFISNQTIQSPTHPNINVADVNSSYALSRYFNNKDDINIYLNIFNLSKHAGGVSEMAVEYVKSNCNRQNSDELF